MWGGLGSSAALLRFRFGNQNISHGTVFSWGGNPGKIRIAGPLNFPPAQPPPTVARCRANHVYLALHLPTAGLTCRTGRRS